MTWHSLIAPLPRVVKFYSAFKKAGWFGTTGAFKWLNIEIILICLVFPGSSRVLQNILVPWVRHEFRILPLSPSLGPSQAPSISFLSHHPELPFITLSSRPSVQSSASTAAIRAQGVFTSSEMHVKRTCCSVNLHRRPWNEDVIQTVTVSVIHESRMWRIQMNSNTCKTSIYWTLTLHL